jgi:hypothetical protein
MVLLIERGLQYNCYVRYISGAPYGQLTAPLGDIRALTGMGKACLGLGNLDKT